jgi:EAL domain-containing protein (putative c-di-GMP-specific phosphodiesterase class I)
VWRLPYGETLDGKAIPSFAVHLAGRKAPATGDFPLDYSLDIDTIPAYSAADVLDGKVSARQLAGKKVIVGPGSDILNDVFFFPGYGRGFGAEVQIVGAETLQRGSPVSLGWFPGFLAALALSALALKQRRQGARYAILGAGIVLALAVPVPLETRLIFADVTPALFVLITILSVLVWRRLRSEGLKNPVSGLPNLNALRHNRAGRKKALVAARVLNYEEALATLPPNNERQLVEQIVARLQVGDGARTIYQGDNGIFAWFAEPNAPFGNHLEALYALFRNPARVAKLSVDLSVTFGVEVGSGRSIASRLASALVAAEEAARDGLKWRYHDPETLEDATWRLSMLSQLDEAIDKGEVWIAYQPKLDLTRRKIIGCEALARWTHPKKGPIAASEFVAAAEAHNRIGKLTDFVLEQAVANALQLVKRAGGEFEMAVNMSASLLIDKSFALRLSALLARHGLAPKHLILELTETAALASSGDALEMINRLRELGVGIAIDDYGTGLSTLDYLKRIPAMEIKIDQSFVKGIVENRSDRVMVQSTIQLAHSLGCRVVAEGAELREIVDLLVEMECDVAQGYAVGRPMSLESLAKRIAADRKRTAA